MDNEKLLRKYKSIRQFREYTQQECSQKTDSGEKESCDQLFQLIDTECKRMENIISNTDKKMS
jgi:hypothetical protein